MSTEFEWDPGKADINRAKHGISFDEAASAFLDPMALSGPDPDHSANETRYVTFAHSRLGQLLAISHTYRLGGIRLISARRVTRSERKLYEEN